MCWSVWVGWWVFIRAGAPPSRRYRRHRRILSARRARSLDVCPRRCRFLGALVWPLPRARPHHRASRRELRRRCRPRQACLLYPSDAADERSSVDLGGTRIIKKKNRTNTTGINITYKIQTTATALSVLTSETTQRKKVKICIITAV